MSEESVDFLSVLEAGRLIGAIQEEEDIDVVNKRILTVYSKDNKELCWFDFDEVMTDVGAVEEGDRMDAVRGYIIQRIPSWVKEL
ncbi:MAG: hypothetical protein COA36_04945 [Desulfotalea sp.]|nr:MAG: hypothetical protein COA36_04945 [Desulfotalea sp.]